MLLSSEVVTWLSNNLQQLLVFCPSSHIKAVAFMQERLRQIIKEREKYEI